MKGKGTEKELEFAKDFSLCDLDRMGSIPPVGGSNAQTLIPVM